MVRRKRLQHLVDKHNMLKVVNHTLAIQKVHRRSEPIPVQTLREPQSPRSGRHIRNSDNLLERDNLDSSDDEDDIDMSHSHSGEETSDHGQRPHGAGDEGFFFLFVFGDLGVLEL